MLVQFSLLPKKTKTPVEGIKIEKPKPVRIDLSRYVTVSSSNYAYGVLGGINNLSVIFSNKSDYTVDEITAKIVYLKANGKAWKTKYVSVFNVAPHSEKREALPKVNRGKSVEVSLHKMASKKIQYSYTAGKR